MAVSPQLKSNADQLAQGIEVILGLPEQVFGEHRTGLLGASIGEHWRHVIEHFDCFANGLVTGKVDYTARCRNQRLGLDLRFASESAQSLLTGLLRFNPEPDTTLLVRHEPGNTSGFFDSSVGRELEFLFSHTAHHFATIAIALVALGIERPEGFGLAESTRQFLAANSNQAADPGADA